MKAAIAALAGVVLLTAGCSHRSEPAQQATSAHVRARVFTSVQAEKRCLSAGGTPAFSRQLDGTAVGMCQLSNGRRCHENALLSGRCLRY